MLEYKIYEDGYEILKGGKVWISQRGKYAPKGDYEEEAKKEIERLKNVDKQSTEQYTTEERISALEDAINSILGF